MILGMILGTILGDTVKAIIGNRTDTLLMNSLGAIAKNFENTEKRLINHDLQKAVVRSFYLAKISVCKKCITEEKGNTRAIDWLKDRIKEFKSIINKVNADKYIFLPFDDINDIKLLLTTENTRIADQKTLIEYAKEENCNSYLYNEYVESSFYERICCFFAFEIKHNSIVNNIFQSQLITNIDIKLNQLIDTLSFNSDYLLPELKNIEKRIEENNQNIEKIYELMLSSFVDFGTELKEILEKVNNLTELNSDIDRNTKFDIDQITLKVVNTFAIVYLYILFVNKNNNDECFETGFSKIFLFSLEDSFNKLASILQTVVNDCFIAVNYTLPSTCQDVIVKQLFSLENAIQYLSAKHSLKVVCMKMKEILIENDSDSVFIEHSENIVIKIINIIAGKIEDQNDLKSISEYRFSDELINDPKVLMNFINKRQNSVQTVIHRFAINSEKEITFFPVSISDDFFGREDKLAEMWDEFNTGKRIIILWGIDGIGKTKLARNFANVYKKYIGRTHEIRLENKIQGQISSLLDTVIQGFRFSSDIEKKCSGCLDAGLEYKLKKAVLNELSESELIFIDNINLTSKTDINNLMELNCKFIITSQTRIDYEQVATINVKELDFSVLKNIFIFESNLNNCIDFNDEEKLRLLFVNVNHHTMTVKLLARLMCFHNKTIDDLLNISENMVDDKSVIDEDFGNLNTTIGHLINIYKNTKITQSEQRFLNNLALISSKGINADQFLKWLNLENYNEINSLSSLSWVIFNKDTKNIRLHPIITTTLLAMNTINPNDCKGTINGIIEMLDFSVCFLFTDVQNLIEYGQYLEKMLNNINYSEPKLLEKLSDGYRILGKHEKSLELAAKIKTLPGMQRVFIIIANVEVDKWNYNSAIDKYKEALDFIKDDFKIRGEIYLDIAKCHLAIGENEYAAKAFLDSYNSFMNASYTFGAGVALINYFLIGDYKHRYINFLNEYGKIVLNNAKTEPNCIILYSTIYTIYIAKKKKILSSVNDADEILRSFSFVDERYGSSNHIKKFLEKYVKNINNSTNEPLNMVKEMLSIDSSDNNTQEKETQEFIDLLEWMELCFSKIGQYLDIAQVLVMIIGSFPELSFSSGVIHNYLEKKFENLEKRVLVGNALIVQLIIAIAQLKGKLLGNKMELSKLNYILDMQINILPNENQYSLALSFEALGNWYSSNIKWYGTKWAEKYFEKALEIKHRVGASPIEEAKLLLKMGRYGSAIKILENEKKPYSCTLCKCYVSKVENNTEENKVGEIKDCIKKVNQICLSM